MTRHFLQNRSEDEVLWWARRDVLKAAAAWAAAGGLPTALAQERGNVVQLSGRALLNQRALLPGQTIQTGDEIRTGPGSTLVFAIGDAAFLVRQNTLMRVERGRSLNTVSLLRVLSGGVASVWGQSGIRTVVTPTLAASFRGAGLYTEVLPLEDNRTYFCNCYGAVDLNAGGSKLASQSSYHQSFWAEARGEQGSRIARAPFLNHTDDELEFLASLIRQRTDWQRAGRKGTPDGSGRPG